MIFSAPMIQALLAGRKTQTRRVLSAELQGSPYLHPDYGSRTYSRYEAGGRLVEHSHTPGRPHTELVVTYVRFAPGDRLWVREAWAHDGPDLETVRSRLEDALGGIGYGPYFRATEGSPDTLSWRSPIHMPRWASRLTLVVTDVRVERLQDISEADAQAEGAEGMPTWGSYRNGFNAIWLDIHGPEAWAANPWVAAISFRVHQANIDALTADALDIARAA